MQVFAFVTSFVLLAGSITATPTSQEQSTSSSIVTPSQVGVVSSVPSQVDVPQPVVVDHQHPSGVHHHHHHQQQQHHQPASYYSTVGSSVVAPEPVPVKPQAVPARSVSPNEQYGQPESAALPANYKPFGSWGLYIGGNPADGYYTNYYKALTNTVDKQLGVEPASPAVKPQVQSPALRQAISPAPVSSTPYVGGDFYSFAYAPSDLSSAVPMQASQQPTVGSPVGQFYGAPAAPASPLPADYPSSYSPDFYSTKKIGQVAQKEAQTNHQSKGHQQNQHSTYYYSYAPVQMAAPIATSPQQKPQQVVAYPVPVGSQIVGSQPGVDGSFDPYGIHAFTRYAVKPTVVSQAVGDSTYYYSYPAHQQHVVPSYKQQPVYSYPSSVAYNSFYGYPVNQLHYSQAGLIVPVQGEHQPHQVEGSPVQPLAGEPSSDKVDQVDQVKPQKRA